MKTVIKLRIASIAADRDIAASPEALRRDLSAALTASLSAHVTGTPVQWPITASPGAREIARQATENAAAQGALSQTGPATPAPRGAAMDGGAGS